MFAVPKDTKLLIFDIEFAADLSSREIKPVEAMLTKKTGIPCIVIDAKLIKANDWRITFQPESPEQRLEPVEKPDVVLSEDAGQKGKDRNHKLRQRKPILFSGKDILLLGLPLLLPIALFFLGALVSFLFQL